MFLLEQSPDADLIDECGIAEDAVRWVSEDCERFDFLGSCWRVNDVFWLWEAKSFILEVNLLNSAAILGKSETGSTINMVHIAMKSTLLIQTLSSFDNKSFP